MSAINFLNFKGTQPAKSPKLLQDGWGQTANNVFLESGMLEPLLNPVSQGALTKTGALQTLYLLGTNTWLHWTEQVSVARVPIENNSLDRVAYTGVGAPRATDAASAIAGGGTAYPEVSYLLGVPAPTTILTVTPAQDTPQGLQVQFDIAGTVTDGLGNKVARVYTYTFVTAWGEEGPPADPSDIIYVGDDDVVNIANFDSMPTGAYQIDKVRIYRTVSGSPTDTTYLLVAEVPFPVNPTPYVDSKPSSQLSESLKSTTWDAPPSALEGITNMANGILAGYIDNDLYFAEPFQGHAWPADYKRTLDYKINGLASVGNMLFVMTEGYPYIVTGNHPTLLTLSKLEQTQACVSTRSIVEMASGAIYASSEGLVFITRSGAKLITKGIYSTREWSNLNPSSIHAYFYKDKYMAFHSGGAFQFDVNTGEFTTSDIEADAAFSSMVTGKLHYSTHVGINNMLNEFDSDTSSPMTLTWKSKMVETTRTNIEAARVSAESYPVDFTLIADGVTQPTITVQDDEPFRLPRGYIARVWEVVISTTNSVYSVSIADDVDSLL